MDSGTRPRAIPGVINVEVLTYLRLVKQWQPEYLRDADDTRTSQVRNGGATIAP